MWSTIKDTLEEYKDKKIVAKIIENEKQKINQPIIYLEKEKFIIENILLMQNLAMKICNFNNQIISIEDKINSNINDDIMYKNFVKIYKEVKDVKSLEEFESILNLEKLSEILIVNFYPYIRDEYYINSNVINVGKSIIKNRVDDEIIKNFLCNKDIFEFNLDVTVKHKEYYKKYYPYKIQNAWFMIMCAKALNKLLFYYKYKVQFIKNDELYKISQNLYKEFKKYEIVSEKIYPIYIKFYQDTFENLLEYDIFNTIVYLANTDIIYKNTKLVKDNKLFRELDYILKMNKITYNDVYMIICKILEENYKENYCDDDIVNIYTYIISKCIYNISLKELLNLYSKKSILLKDLKKNKKELEVKILKDRYLKGDFTIDRESKKEELNIKNIKTGQEFELYLKRIFIELGYKVEMTKSTGDQGADLIIIKNNIKTVVQAKFYSNSVGNKAIQEVVGAIKYYGADKGMVVTNSYYTKSAISLADANKIELINGEELKKIIDSIY